MNDASRAYLRVRQKEGRLYSDEAVAHLPHVPRVHPLWREWRLRAESARRLYGYLAQLQRPIKLLDLGCGNGWLSNRLASLPNCQVWGVDRNQVELEQAARVFGNSNRVAFAEADIFCPPFPAESFDVIIVASAIQYFADLPLLVRQLLALLQPGGELHVQDSPLYAAAEVAAARARSETYYREISVPEMTGFYHHHTYEAALTLAPTFLHDPRSPLVAVKRRLGIVEPPFPWLRFRV